MTPESPSSMDRLRAGVAALLASLAAGAHRLEEWSARGVRPLLVGLAVMVVLVVGALAAVGGGRQAAGWLTGDTRPAHAREEFRGKPEGKFEMKPGPHAIGKPEAKPVGKPEGKPEAPRPPGPPPPPPGPPPPPAP